MLQRIFRRINLESAKADVEALLRYEKPQRVPNGTMCFGEAFAVVDTGQDIAEIFHKPEAIYTAACRTADRYGWNPFLQYSKSSVLGCFDFGGTMAYPTKNGEFFLPREYPVKTESDVEKLTLPDLRTAGNIQMRLQLAEVQQAAGFPVTFSTRSPFCMAADLCGLTQFLSWITEKPDLCQALMAIAYQHILQVLDVWVTTFGAENLQVWVNTPVESNQLISPEHLERFALPYHLKFGAHLKAIGVRQLAIHLCGDQNRNLPLLAEADPWAHPTILSFGVEVDMEKAAAIFPRDIIFGNIDTMLLQNGSPKAVFDTCRELIDRGKRIEGGFILAPGCEPPVFMPPANMHAITQALEACGAY